MNDDPFFRFLCRATDIIDLRCQIFAKEAHIFYLQIKLRVYHILNGIHFYAVWAREFFKEIRRTWKTGNDTGGAR